MGDLAGNENLARTVRQHVTEGWLLLWLALTAASPGVTVGRVLTVATTSPGVTADRVLIVATASPGVTVGRVLTVAAASPGVTVDRVLTIATASPGSGRRPRSTTRPKGVAMRKVSLHRRLGKRERPSVRRVSWWNVADGNSVACALSVTAASPASDRHPRSTRPKRVAVRKVSLHRGLGKRERSSVRRVSWWNVADGNSLLAVTLCISTCWQRKNRDRHW